MPDITDLFAQRATLRRSTSLLTAFRFEQSAPERFYGTLARDTVHLITDLWQQAEGAELRGHTVLDVGGGPGYFASAFADAGARYIGVEPDPREMHATPQGHRGIQDPRTTYLRASGMALPLADDSVDICLSSNVAEHVSQPWAWARRCCASPGPAGWRSCRTPFGWARSEATKWA
ncbi:methyltransferase [Mycobacteroides abscessus]|uniref:class I SAM-dependent methyltransferase n=1 Tax=Mycobacteroides abscessus TaxID=36809 RepID=UPI0005E28A1F|nr:class I SAM-dependent methyltransferase [Mycobacteroides abscessus]CPZ57139.1 methyltransferase [Mycobacteroides abscessus]